MDKRGEYDGAHRRRQGEPWTPERVARLRRRLRLSQAAMAERMGVRQQTVSEWETGKYRPRGASVRMLAMLAEEAAPYDAGGPDGEA